jgi:HK97 family phage prohead protease
MDHMSCDFEYKFAPSKPDGWFDGYASNFNRIDEGGDSIVPGAFKSVLLTSKPKMLLHHAGLPYTPPTPENMIPVGKWESLSEDTKGLATAGRLINLDTESGKRIYGAMKEGELNGLSVGYKVGRVKYGQKAGEPRRTIQDFKALPEISLVTYPMDADARISSVKAADIRTIREFEDFLRDVGGYSHGAAKSIAACGFKAIAEPRDEDVDGETVADLLKRTRALRPAA